ncbi:MAG: HlyD family efflux transporter periplasmic adaptor subunit [Gemmataceae bacterium]
MMLHKYFLPLAALGMLGFALIHVSRAQQDPPHLEPPIQPARSPQGTAVAGTGTVEAQTENISVGSHLSGIVTEVLVKVGRQVKKGDPLFRLDDRAIQAEVQVRRASLAAARAQLAKLQQMPRPEEIPALQARVAEAKANLADQLDVAQRARRLHASRAIGEEERNRRDQAATMAREQVRRAEADLALLQAGTWEPDLKVAQVNVEQAAAQLRQSETELERLTVNALDDGEVLQVNVRPGEFVSNQAGKALIVLGNVSCLHVRVEIDEHDIPRFSPEMSATATVRGDARHRFSMRRVRVEPMVIPKRSLTGDNTERVDTRVLQVIYAVEDSTRKLYVGQQVDVHIGPAERK